MDSTQYLVPDAFVDPTCPTSVCQVINKFARDHNVNLSNNTAVIDCSGVPDDPTPGTIPTTPITTPTTALTAPIAAPVAAPAAAPQVRKGVVLAICGITALLIVLIILL